MTINYEATCAVDTAVGTSPADTLHVEPLVAYDDKLQVIVAPGSSDYKSESVVLSKDDALRLARDIFKHYGSRFSGSPWSEGYRKGWSDATDEAEAIAADEAEAIAAEQRATYVPHIRPRGLVFSDQDAADAADWFAEKARELRG